MVRTNINPEGGRVARRQRANRDALLRAAFDLFGDRGFHSTTVSELASHADIATGSFYNYFDDKAELLQAAITAFVDPIGDRNQELARDVDDPFVRLALGIRNVLAHGAAEPAWGRFLVQTAYVRGQFASGLLPRMAADLDAAWDAGVIPRARKRGAIIPVLAGAVTGVLLAFDRGALTAADLDEVVVTILRATGAEQPLISAASAKAADILARSGSPPVA